MVGELLLLLSLLLLCDCVFVCFFIDRCVLRSVCVSVFSVFVLRAIFCEEIKQRGEVFSSN